MEKLEKLQNKFKKTSEALITLKKAIDDMQKVDDFAKLTNYLQDFLKITESPI